MDPATSSRALLFCTVVILAPAPAPAAGPVEVHAAALFPTASPGGAGEMSCAVTNATADTTATVILEGSVVYADGRRDRLIGPVRQTLDPGFGFEVAPLFLVPADAALGTATALCEAKVTRIEGATGHAGYEHPLAVADTATFEVVP